MPIVERLVVGLALFTAAHFSMGYINPSAGGSGGAVLFPYATDAPTRWLFGTLDGSPFAVMIPILIGLAGVAVLAFFLALLATFHLWISPELWRPLVLIGAASSAILLVLHPSIYVVAPLALDSALAWVAWTSAWTPEATA